MSRLNPTSFAEITRLHRAVTNGLKGALVVTAAAPGEGTSLTGYLLARRSAEDGKRTLFVDLNLKNTQITEKMGLNPQNWDIQNFGKLEDVADFAVPQMPTLDVLPAPADAETVRWLCEQEQATMLFEALAKRYDHIVVDTTPLSLTNRNNADPILLAAAADRAILVFQSGVLARHKIKAAVQDLQASGANLLGVVVNQRMTLTPREAMLKCARAFYKISPSFSNWLTYRARSASK